LDLSTSVSSLAILLVVVHDYDSLPARLAISCGGSSSVPSLLSALVVIPGPVEG
jgi:hypothetical protein